MCITKWCLDVALCLACILNYDFRARALWLLCKQRRGAPLPSDIDAASLEQILEDHFLASDVDRLMSWVDPSTTRLSHTVLKVAQQFVKGHLLADWVRRTNVIQGIVVRTESLIGRFNASVAVDFSSNVVLSMVQTNAHPTGRKWAQRWRSKHGAVVGKLRVREAISKEEMHEKAITLEL